MVSILGGNQYSNILYGTDARGRFLLLNTKDEYYTLLSSKMFGDIKAKDGFVQAKSYNRTQLLGGTLNQEFRIHNENYSSKI